MSIGTHRIYYRAVGVLGWQTIEKLDVKTFTFNVNKRSSMSSISTTDIKFGQIEYVTVSFDDNFNDTLIPTGRVTFELIGPKNETKYFHIYEHDKVASVSFKELPCRII